MYSSYSISLYVYVIGITEIINSASKVIVVGLIIISASFRFVFPVECECAEITMLSRYEKGRLNWISFLNYEES